jgi:hypothetical protein
MIDKGKRKISAILLVLMTVGSFAATMNINLLTSPLMSFAKSNPNERLRMENYKLRIEKNE